MQMICPRCNRPHNATSGNLHQTLAVCLQCRTKARTIKESRHDPRERFDAELTKKGSTSTKRPKKEK